MRWSYLGLVLALGYTHANYALSIDSQGICPATILQLQYSDTSVSYPFFAQKLNFERY